MGLRLVRSGPQPPQVLARLLHVTVGTAVQPPMPQGNVTPECCDRPVPPQEPKTLAGRRQPQDPVNPAGSSTEVRCIKTAELQAQVKVVTPTASVTQRMATNYATALRGHSWTQCSSVTNPRPTQKERPWSRMSRSRWSLPHSRRSERPRLRVKLLALREANVLTGATRMLRAVPPWTGW